MNVNCNIIRDLLPLYAEDLASQESRQLVDNHLCGCDGCTKALAELKKAAPIPVERESKSLRQVKRNIVRRRGLSIMAALSTMLLVISLVLTWFITPFQLTAEQAIDDFYVREDGALVIDYASYVIGRRLMGVNENVFILLHSTRYDMLKAENREPLEERYGADGVITEEERLRYDNMDVHNEPWYSSDGHTTNTHWDRDYNWWYADPSGKSEATLLYDAAKPQEPPTETTGIYPQVFFGTLALSLVCLLLRRSCKKAWLRELIFRIAVLSGSVAGSLLFVSSGRLWSSCVGIINQHWSVLTTSNAMLLTLASLFWRQLYLLNKQDGGKL